MVSPFREPPRFLVCPRCADLLEGIVPGVSMCPRCEGVWLTTPTLQLAFGDAQWPHGQMMWWHNQLECPECAHGGIHTVMDAKSAGGVNVDSCPAHGLWLDRGELGRIMHSTGDELAVLLGHLETHVDAESVIERRARWRTDQRSQKQALAEALEAHARAAEEVRVDAEREQRAREVRAQQQRHQDEHDDLVSRRRIAQQDVARIDARLSALRVELDLQTSALAKAHRVLAAIDEKLREE